jgi:hypothetical protein
MATVTRHGKARKRQLQENTGARQNREIAHLSLHSPQADQHDATSQARQKEYAIAALPHAVSKVCTSTKPSVKFQN